MFQFRSRKSFPCPSPRWRQLSEEFQPPLFVPNILLSGHEYIHELMSCAGYQLIISRRGWLGHALHIKEEEELCDYLYAQKYINWNKCMNFFRWPPLSHSNDLKAYYSGGSVLLIFYYLLLADSKHSSLSLSQVSARPILISIMLWRWNKKITQPAASECRLWLWPLIITIAEIGDCCWKWSNTRISLSNSNQIDWLCWESN